MIKASERCFGMVMLWLLAKFTSAFHPSPLCPIRPLSTSVYFSHTNPMSSFQPHSPDLTHISSWSFQSSSADDENMRNGDDANNANATVPQTLLSDSTRNTNLEDGMSNEELMASIGTSPRRIFLSIASASGIALGANFFGVTSKLLTAFPESAVESTTLDTYYPRGEFKRFRGTEYGYTFLFPKQWVGDTALELAKAQRRTVSLDYTMKTGQKSKNTLPDAAFGPPGKLNARGVSQSDTNLSVIATPLPPTFRSLEESLGSPTSAAETLLKVSLAPEGSGRSATLIDACEERRGNNESEVVVYQFNYRVDRGSQGVPLRAISTIAVRPSSNSNIGSNTLVTLTVVAPEEDWERDDKYASKLRRVADSFKLTR